MADPGPDPPKASRHPKAETALSRFRRTYVLALGLVATLAISGQALVQYELGAQLSSAEVINIAGRQRMLSQRLTKTALLIVDSDPARAEAARGELEEDLASWETSHERLARGDLAHPDHAITTPETRSKLDAVEPAYRELFSALQTLRTPGATSAQGVEDILEAERRYLPLMDDLVFAYSRVAEARVARTRRVEGVLLALTLLVLVLEALFVFRPMQGALERTIRRLQVSLEKLRTSEARYGRAVAGARDGFWDWHIETTKLDVSDRFRQLWSLPRTCDLEWSDLIDRLAASDRPQLQAWIDEGATSAIDLEVRVQREDGWGWIRLVGAPTGDGYVSGRLSDIDERRSLYAERDRLIAVQNAQLQDADEAIRRTASMNAAATLAGGLAHDFNNFLQVVSLATEQLEQDALPDQAESVGAIRAASDEASGLARQLLMLTRSEVGTTLEPVALAQTIQDLEPLLSRMAEDRSLTIRVEDGLPDVDGDAGQLRQALVNLVGNARDATASGGTVRVSAEAKVRSGRAGVEVAVADDGCGMSDEVRRRVFEPFFTTKKLGKGTGLGLAMVHRIVERHGGGISIASTEGKGTTISLWLPARRGLALVKNETRRAPSPPLVLLLVDDDPTIVAALRRQLKLNGHEVYTAGSAEAALEVASEVPDLDLVITDVMLPGMLGPELADELRRHFNAELPVLFMSGYAAEHVDLNAPRTRRLVKPFSIDALEREIANLVQYVRRIAAQ